MTFQVFVLHCFDHQAFMTQYRRLTGSTLGLERSTLARMIDDATGAPVVDEKEALAFIKFVRDYVWVSEESA